MVGDDSNVSSVFRYWRDQSGSVISTNYVDVVTRHRDGGTLYAATGGRIRGAGTSTSDSIPAMLSNGEMVLRAAAVKKIDAVYGRSFLNTLNAVGSVEKAMQPSAFALNARRKSQAYATGGRVSTANGSWNVEVNPVIKVELPANTGNTTNNTVTINGVESSDRRIATRWKPLSLPPPGNATCVRADRQRTVASQFVSACNGFLLFPNIVKKGLSWLKVPAISSAAAGVAAYKPISSRRTRHRPS